jgi:hypothetical protein
LRLSFLLPPSRRVPPPFSPDNDQPRPDMNPLITPNGIGVGVHSHFSLHSLFYDTIPHTYIVLSFFAPCATRQNCNNL